MSKLTHVDGAGKARMVDVGSKRATRRKATAAGGVLFNRQAFEALSKNRLGKGDALAVARIAGIQAAKRTAELIPLCHTIPLDHVDVTIELDPERRRADVRATASARWTTGVEMEALVAVSAACMALFDMAKALDRGITLTEIRVVAKSGGRSGTWRSSRARSGA